jgi:hypothetical protein
VTFAPLTTGLGLAESAKAGCGDCGVGVGAGLTGCGGSPPPPPPQADNVTASNATQIRITEHLFLFFFLGWFGLCRFSGVAQNYRGVK